MAPTLAERAEAVFLEARAVDPAARAAFLDEACAGQPELRREVEGLLAAAQASEAYFERLPGRLGLADFYGAEDGGGRAVETGDFARGGGGAAAAQGAQRRSVGPYRLLRELGRGGMGTVWLAARADGLISRPVALKFPRGSWVRAGLNERMARERELLASLEHPGIARLYDAGLTESGDPWLALEYVEGAPLNEYCAREQPGLRARLELFLQVADAVAYAHSKLIIHRDLKPENILVTRAGQARLLDFGVAQLLDGQQARQGSLTELTGRALTPDYASPEQIRGQPLTVATDTYSLGVILYELLTGQRPYRLKRDTPGALEDAILETIPAPPSRAAHPVLPRTRLAGDLDAITLKALRKEAEARYPTVQSLADDLRRYLAGHPVMAQPDSPGYRLRKFLLRHKLAAATVSIAAAAVVSGAALAIWQAGIARAEARRAESVTAFVASIFQGVDPNHLGRARAVTANEILAQAERRVTSELAAEPRIRLRLRSLIGQSYLGLFEPERARAVLDEALADAAATAGVDEAALRNLHLLAARAQDALGHPAEAEAHLGTVLSLVDGRRDADYVAARIVQSGIDYERGAYDAALAAGRDALAAAEDLPEIDRALVADAHTAVGKAFGMLRDAPLSLEHNRRAFEIALARFGNDHEHPQVLDAEHNLAASLIDVARLDEAIPHLERSLAAARATYGDDSLLAGRFAVRLGLVHLERGELARALELIDGGIRIEEAVGAPATPAMAGRKLTLARGYLAARRMSDAAREADAALEVMQQFDAPFMLRVVEADRAFAHAAAGGPLAAAVGKLEQIVAEQDAGDPRYKTHLPDIHIGLLHLWNDDAGAAIRHLERGVELAQAQTRVAHLGEALVALGYARLENGDPGGAREALREGLEHLDAAHTEPTPARAEAVLGLGRVALADGEIEAARRLLSDAARFWDGFARENRMAGVTAFWLGQARIAAGQREDAAADLDRARRQLARSHLPADLRLLRDLDAK